MSVAKLYITLVEDTNGKQFVRTGLKVSVCPDLSLENFEEIEEAYMPRRKKMLPVPDYTGIGRNSNNAWIQKSRPLQSLSETDLTLPEFKILDAYLARINSHDPEKRTVRLEKGELERCLGVSRILKDDLNKRLRHLFQVIEVKDESKRKGFKLINLFEEADAEQDDNGLWQITLTCTPSAREYVFNVDNIGYLRYRLRNVINLTSRYSYVLFLYLIDNRWRKTWKEDLDELKVLLNCTAESYDAFKWFNSKILKKCHEEISEKTELSFSYKPVKKGRKVAQIEFTVETMSDFDEIIQCDFEQLSIDEILEESDKSDSYSTNQLSLLAEACNCEFSDVQMQEILSIICTMDIPKHMDNIDLGRYHYLRKMYAKINAEAERKAQQGEKIKNRFRYFVRMIEKEK